MVARRLFFVQALALYILFASSTFAAIQNVTVDDAAKGDMITYLPASTDWREGTDCPTCLVQPDPSLAYDGTWHIGRYFPTANITQAFQISFIGSGLYIFFILANTVPGVTTFTNVNFFLDGVQVSSFFHSPSTSTDFEYNQTVYANDSIPYGQHTMKVSPVNDSVDSVVMLFDYFIYTTNTSQPSPVSTDASQSSPVSTNTNQPSPVNAETNSGPDVGAIVGGTIGGLATLILAIAAAIYYLRYKGRKAGRTPSLVVDAVNPFMLPREMAPTPAGSPLDQPGSRHKPIASAPLATVPLSSASPTTEQVSSGGLSSVSAAAIIEQVGLLRDELSRLHHTRSQELEPPPGYSSRANE